MFHGPIIATNDPWVCQVPADTKTVEPRYVPAGHNEHAEAPVASEKAHTLASGVQAVAVASAPVVNDPGRFTIA